MKKDSTKHLCERSVSAYIRGTLKPVRAKEVKEHLRQCRKCRANASSAGRTRDAVLVIQACIF